jgi:transposase
VRKIKRAGKVYLAEVENVRIQGKVVQRHLRYVGKEADGKQILSASISNVKIDQVKIFGPLLVLHHLAKDLGLSERLGDFGDEILSMVFAHCVDYESVNQMPGWFERTDLNMLLDLESLTEERLLHALDSLEGEKCMELQRNIFDAVKKKYKIDSSGILYDVTNTYLYGKKCPLGRRGKDKEGVKGRPLIQIGLGVTKKEGIPVFHKVFHGNIHDARTLQDLLSTFEDVASRQGLLVFDRGITSKKNQKEIKNLHLKVLCGLPIKGTLKDIVRQRLSQQPLAEYKNRIRLGKSIFYAVRQRYSIDNVKGTLALCFNKQQRNDLKESRYDELDYAQQLLQQKKPIKPGLGKFFNDRGEVIPSKLREAEEFDGYSCIFTTDQLTCKEMVRMYFDKDLVEKAFQGLKGIIRLRPIRHWLYNRVIAHVFICYLSYLLLSLFKMKLKKLQLSPVTALRELSTLYKVYMRDPKKGFKIHRVVALNKIQEKILRSVNKKLLTQV